MIMKANNNQVLIKMEGIKITTVNIPIYFNEIPMLKKSNLLFIYCF